MKNYLLFFLLALTLFCGCQRAPSNSSSTPQPPLPLIVGMDLGYPPFETIDAQGNPSGVSVDLAQALGASLHRSIKIENIPFTGLIPSLLTGKIDLIISSMTDTLEREKTIAFSDPYLTIGLAVLAGKKSGFTNTQNLDQPGRILAVRQGTTGQVWAQSHLQHTQVLVLDKESSAVLEVIQGKADGFLYDQMSVWKNHEEHPVETVALLTPVQRESWAIGLRPNDAELRGQVNTFLAAFRASGGFEHLGDKYLKEQKESFAKAGIPFYF